MGIIVPTYVWVLKRPSHLDGSFDYPQHIFGLRNKKNNFQIRTLNWRPRVVFNTNSKTCLKHATKKKKKSVFNTDNRFIQVKTIAEYSNGSILQYFWPSLSYFLY